MKFKKNFFLINKISYKKISFFRSILKIEPFNNSYCDSLGNFIRRSIYLTNYDFKITFIKIFNVNSEYSNLKGIKENVQEIIENLKKILIKIDKDLIAYLVIKKNGPCIVRAKDIFSDKKIFIYNPNSIIVNITKKITFFCIMKCNYTSLKFKKFKNIFFNSKIIKINNDFSLIKDINYYIHYKIFNKKLKILFFDIETNGVFSPEKCFKNCIYYLKKYFNLFFSIINIKKKNNIKNNKIIINPIFIRSIDHLEISIRTSNVLKRNNIYLIGDLITLSENNIINLKFMNKNIYFEILESLKNKKLKLNVKIDYEIQF